MASQHTTSQKLISIAAAALVALGLVTVFGKLDGPAPQLTNLLGTVARKALELLPYFIPAAWHAIHAYVFDHLRFSPCPLEMLASLWPLLYVLAGVA